MLFLICQASGRQLVLLDNFIFFYLPPCVFKITSALKDLCLGRPGSALLDVFLKHGLNFWREEEKTR